MDIDAITSRVVDAAFRLHVAIGPGLLESVYERLIARQLGREGLSVEAQKHVSFEMDGMHFENGFRVDLLVAGVVVVEIKSLEHLQPVHSKQLLTYLRLLKLPVGLLINFGAATLKQGLRRIVNNYNFSAPHAVTPRLRVNQQDSTPPRD